MKIKSFVDLGWHPSKHKGKSDVYVTKITLYNNKEVCSRTPAPTIPEVRLLHDRRFLKRHRVSFKEFEEFMISKNFTHPLIRTYKK